MREPRPHHAIGLIASRQHDVISTHQLHEAGLSRNQIRHLVQIGWLFRIHRGVYSVGRPATEPRSRMAGALLACGSNSLLSHRAAAVAWGMLPDLGSVIDVSVSGRHVRSRQGLRAHRVVDLAPVDRRREDGLAIVSPSLALLGIAAIEPFADLEHAFNEALLLRLTTASKLEDVARRFHGHRGLGRLLPLMRAQNGDFSRKEAEKRLLSLLRAAGLPAPRRNVKVHGFELDFYWPDINLNVEMDGYRWHSTRERLNSDRERDLDLQARGVRVQRVSYDQLLRPERLIARLAATFALAGRAAELEGGHRIPALRG